jgi:hypothetical protein
MEFDFYDQYKGLSTTELLKILKQPENYLPEAVEAATKILQERQVSEDDLQQVDEYFEGIAVKAQQKTEKVQAYKEKVADFLEPVLQPQVDIKPQKWIRIFLLVLAIQYLWTLVVTGRQIIVAFTRHWVDITTYLQLITLVYIPVIFYLLFRRKRWGWILLFADNLFSFIATLGQTPELFGQHSFIRIDPSAIFWTLFIRGAFIFFLWKPVMAEYFGVLLPVKKKTVIITIILTLLFMFSMYFY